MGPQKPKTNPKIWSKLKVRIKGSIENKSCSAIQSDPKNVFEPNPTSKLAHWGPKKPKGPQNYAKVRVGIKANMEIRSRLTRPPKANIFVYSPKMTRTEYLHNMAL